MNKLLWLAIAICFLSYPFSAFADGKISGRISAHKSLKNVEISEEKEYLHEHKSGNGHGHDMDLTKKKRSLEISESKARGVKNAVVIATPIGETGNSEIETSISGFQVSQKNRKYDPHLIVIRPGDSITFLNPGNDFPGLKKKDLHSVVIYSYDEKRVLENRAMPPFRKRWNYVFEKPGVYRINCEPHPHMQAWVVVLEESVYFAVTDEKGQYEISLPEGKYRIGVFHERTLPNEFWQLEVKGTRMPIIVKDGDAARVNYLLMPAGQSLSGSDDNMRSDSGKRHHEQQTEAPSGHTGHQH